MDFSTIRTQVRVRLLEATARFFTDAQINTWINLGYYDVLARTGWAERLTVAAAVANQFEYDLPSKTIKVKKVRWEDQYRIEPRAEDEFAASVGASVTSTSARPYIYTLYPWDKKIRFYPIPSTASPATAINDAAGINSTVATITVDSTADFPSHGRILIGSEQILYYAKTATTFAQCVRGDGRTTAASHSDNAAVTLGEIYIYNTYVPADLSGDTDEPLINVEYQEALIDYAESHGWRKREDYKKATDAMERYVERVSRAEGARLRDSLDGPHFIRDVDEMEDAV